MLTARDQEVAKQRARNRRMNRLEEREALRLKLQAENYVDCLHSGLDALRTGYEMRDGELVELTPKRTNQLKVAHEGYFRLLDRVLPPLKAVEVTKDPDRPEDATVMSTKELLALARSRMPAIEGEVMEPEPVVKPDPVVQPDPAFKGSDRVLIPEKPAHRNRFEQWPFG